MSTRWTTRHLRRVVRLYETGLSTREVAHITGIPLGTITHWLRAEGVMRTISEGKRLADDRRRRPLAIEAARLRREGLSYAMIARELGCSYSRARDLILHPPRPLNGHEDHEAQARPRQGHHAPVGAGDRSG